MTRKILVTGASAGIGKAVCKSRLTAGDHVIGLARDFSKFADHHRGNFNTIEIDLANLDELPTEFTELSHNLHPDTDALVCNAGEAIFGHLEQFSYKQIRHALDLNFLSHVFLVRAFLPNFKKREQGDIILIGSEAGLRGGRQGSLYCASKFALRGFAQALREEIAATGIRLTMINPGMVKTGFHDNLTFRPGSDTTQHIVPEDVASAVSLALDSRCGTVYDEINLTPQKRVVEFGKKN